MRKHTQFDLIIASSFFALDKEMSFCFMNKEAIPKYQKAIFASQATITCIKYYYFAHRVEINLFDTMIVYFR